MNEPQVWTLIGVFAAALIGLITIMTQLMMRTLSAKFDTVNERIAGLRTELVLRFERVDEKFAQVDERLGSLDVRMGRVEQRVDDIDRDVQAISRRIFPD